MSATKHFAVKLKRSPHHWPETQRKTLLSLGLSRFGKTVYLNDTPAIRGMLWKVVHAIELTPQDGAAPGGKRKHKSEPKAAAPEAKAKAKPRAKKEQRAAKGA